MKVPIKIEPDSLVQTVVEVRYTLRLPFEVSLGLLFNALDDTYTYSNSNDTFNNSPIGFKLINSNEVSLISKLNFLFYNDRISFELQPGTIIFNCHNGYIGWQDYKQEILRVLQQFDETKLFIEFKRVGLRYISEYKEMDLTELSRFSFQFGLPEIKSESYTFTSVFNHNDRIIRLNLSNNQQRQSKNDNNESEEMVFSQVDIDVVRSEISINSLDALEEIIEANHSIEKDVFFQLLNDDFLAKLNPIY